MPLTDDEMRKLWVDIFKAPTARDAQTTIGASNLSNGCDFCLASNLTGDMRETPMLDRAYLGRVMGTALHGLAEERQREWLAKGALLSDYARRFPDAKIEERFIIGEIPGYGPVGSTSDLFLPSQGHVCDLKGSKRKDILLLIDFLHMQRTGASEGIFGRSHADIKLSEKQYAEQMVKIEYKVTGYYAQVQLYLRGWRNNGYDASRGSLIFVARDGTGWFDNPGLDGWEDDRKKHDLYVLSFDYDEAYAEMVWNRGVTLWQQLEAGKPVDEFPSNANCFKCGLDRQQAQREAAIGNERVAA